MQQGQQGGAAAHPRRSSGSQQAEAPRLHSAPTAQEMRSPAESCTPCLSWYGDPRELPAGLDLPTTSSRKYYNGFTKVGRTFCRQRIISVSKAAGAFPRVESTRSRRAVRVRGKHTP